MSILINSGNGGQILLTHDTWLMIRGHLSLLDFPMIQQLGQYKFGASCNPIWIYEITKCFCDPFTRTFGPIRKAELVPNCVCVMVFCDVVINLGRKGLGLQHHPRTKTKCS